MREWLKKIRCKKKLSRRFVADKLGVTEMGYTQIENGIRRQDINLSLMLGLASVFGVSVNYILKHEVEFLKAQRKVAVAK